VRDLGSRNGTLVNGRKVKQCRLKSGDLLSGGLTRLRLTVQDAEDDIVTADLQHVSGDGPPAAACVSTPKHQVSVAATAETQATPPCVAGGLLNIPGYEIIRKLGQGGMGVVYLAKQQTTGELAAIKIVVPESTAQDRAMNLFLREARVLSQLHHPHIVRFREM